MQWRSSVTRWLDYFSTFGHLHERKIAQWLTKLAKVFPKFCQISPPPPKMPNTLKILPKWRNFAKSGHTVEETQKKIFKNRFDSIPATVRVPFLIERKFSFFKSDLSSRLISKSAPLLRHLPASFSNYLHSLKKPFLLERNCILWSMIQTQIIGYEREQCWPCECQQCDSK